MDTTDPQESFQHLDQVTASAVSNTGNATVYNIQGDQHLYSSAPLKTWIPPLMLPPRAQSFVGREDDLAWLLQQLTVDAGVTLALCGPGGIGKTALVAEALTQFVAQREWSVHFPGGIFYHSFYTYPSLVVAFEELARIFGEEPGTDPRRAALRALSRHRALLVFDGVDVLSDAQPLWDLGGKNIVLLLSRRQSDTPDLAHRRVLHLLTHEQGILLLQSLAGPRAANRPCVEKLVHHIGGYPLALQLIGSYLSSRQEEVVDYLQWFEQTGLVAIHFGEHQAQSVPVLLQRTYDSLASHEQHLFLILGLLAPAPFPLELVQNILAVSEHVVRQALGTLVNLSVLRRPDQAYEVSHPLVHTFAVERLALQEKGPSSDTITIWRERFLATLATHFEQNDPYDVNALNLWLPHVLPLLAASTLTAQQRLTAASLFNVVGFAASTQGRYAEAEPLYQRALTIREQQLGVMHPNTAFSLNNLAELYREQGKYADAEPLLKQALTIFEQSLGATHPHTATGLNNLGLLYTIQGKYTEAEPLYQRALTIREQRLGVTHLDTALSLGTLAQFYMQQSKYREAEALLQRAYTIFENQLGIQNSLTATCLNDLARLYQIQGKYTEAEPLLVRVLAVFEQQLGLTHPTTASILNNLAELYKSQGKYTEAEPLLVRALAVFEQQLGTTHPTTAGSLNNLAEFYMEQGKYTEAELLYQRALAIREQKLGTQHPDTAISLNNLATLYYKQGKYAEAEPLYQQALIIKDRELDAEHPSMATSLNNLAALYKHQRKYAEAESLYQRALTIREQRLGTTHPDTAISLNNLAELYKEQGKYAEAEPLLVRALAVFEQQLGLTHPDTAGSLNNLAMLYYEQGKYLVAEPLLMRALVIFEQQLGATNSNTALSLNNLALLYQVQGKYTEAELLLMRVSTIFEQQLGLTHPNTVQSLDNLAACYANQGKYAEAKPLIERVLAIRKQTLGETHPTTLEAKMNYDSLLQVMTQSVKVMTSPQRSAQTSHQRETKHKKAKNKKVKQPRKNNRNR